MTNLSFESFINSKTDGLEKSYFTSYAGNIGFFDFQFPDFKKKFPKEFEVYKNNSKSWSAKLRELKHTKELGVKQMLTKTFTLSRRYLKKNDYFIINPKTSASFSLPSKGDQLNLILEKAEEYLVEIFPQIEQKLEFEGNTKTINTKSIRGKINWSKTLLKTINSGTKFPTLFTCTINESTFDTDENVLAISCLLHLKMDISKILKSPKNDDFDYDEIVNISKYHFLANNLLETTNLRNMAYEYENFGNLPLDSRKFSELIHRTRTRVNQGLVKNKSYQKLLDWIVEYRDLNIATLGDYYTKIPWEHEKTIDTMYELWIIFEMLSYFENKKNVKVLEQIKNEKGHFAGFNLSFEGKTFKLLYQEKFPASTSHFGHAAEPDFVVKINQKYPIIMDPKNWTGNFGEAFDKILSYLTNLRQFGAQTGILFFSNKSGMIPDSQTFVKNSDPQIPATTYQFHQNITLSREKLDNHFDMIFEEIKNEL
jgi:hypothetical protein